MKKFIFLLSTFLLILTGTSVFGQFTVTKDTLGGDQVLVRIEHQNGRYVEHIINGGADDINVSFMDNLLQDDGATLASQDVLSKTIALPREGMNSHPIDFYNNGTKIYCFGTKQVMVINAQTGEPMSAVQLANSGSYNVLDYLNFLPVSKFLAANESDGILYCADMANNLYFIDMTTDEVLMSHSMSNYSEQISTSVRYDEANNIVYWMVNSWESTNGTVIRAYDGTNGTLISQRYFNQELNDMLTISGDLIVSEATHLLKLDPISLNTTASISGDYRKLFFLYSNEFVAEEYLTQPRYKQFTIIDNLTFTPVQSILGDWESYRKALPLEDDQSFVCLVGGWMGGPSYLNDIALYKKDGNGDYALVKNKHIYSYELKSMVLSPDGNAIYCAGGNYLGRLNLDNFQIEGTSTLSGCQNWDLTAISGQNGVRLFSANALEGTISMHGEFCNLLNVEQTAFRATTGCFNSHNNKVYFINSRSTYEQSGIVIIDGNTDNVQEALPLGSYLTDAVYNKFSNSVAVSSKLGQAIFFINGTTNDLVKTVYLPGMPNRLFSHQNKVFCGTNAAIYAIDLANNYSISSFPLQFPESHTEYCMDFELNENDNKLYALYWFHDDTYIETIDLLTNSISERKYADLVKGNDLKYDHIRGHLYLANTVLPRLYVLEPSSLSIVEEIDYQPLAVIKQLNLNIDEYKNKAYLTYRELSGNRKHTIIDLESSTYDTRGVNGVNATQTYNALNDQIYYHDASLNATNKLEAYVNVTSCLDDEVVSQIYTGNVLNRNYSFYSLRYWNIPITPVFNPESNKIYWPNGDFSNVSVVNAYTDRLGLKNGWNWLSFPRLERAYNNPAPVIPVLERLNYFPYVELYLIEYGFRELYWNYNGWTGDLITVKSTDGYKLNHEIVGDGASPAMVLYGAILDPETEIPLNPNTSNWVGYFIEDAQMPLDAIPEVILQHLTRIQAQYWAMFRPNTAVAWRYKGRVMPIQYGDMVIIDVDEQCTLVWNQPDQAAEEMDLLVPEYFAYEEQANYLPLFVEMDAESDIQEIAVLANGMVMGAAVREPGDTLIQVSAYLGGVPEGTPLSFETWSGYKSAPVAPGSYAVFDPVDNKYISRTLYKGENAPYHAVSLKAGANAVAPDNRVELSCAPNPSTGETTFTIRIEEMAKVKLTIRDINGRAIATLLDSEMPKGLYHTKWYGTHDDGSDAANGVYFYSLSIDGWQQAFGKLVLIK